MHLDHPSCHLRPWLWGSLGVITLLTPTPATAGYGDTLKVKGDSPLPPGWAVIQIQGPMLMSKGPVNLDALKAHVTLTLKNLNDAPKGAREKIHPDSPLPNGWVVVANHVGFNSSCSTREIMCMIAPSGQPSASPKK